MSCKVASDACRTGRKLWRPAVLLLALALVACNPMISAYRDVRGISKDDPNPATTPNTRNLALAEAAPYPNLASVPPPPTRGMTAGERARLTKGLIAERTDVQTTDEKLRAGALIGWKPPPPPPPLPAGALAGNPPAVGKPGFPGATAAVGKGSRKPGESPQPGPMESPLVSPRIAETPQPEPTRQPPQRPHLAPAPAAGAPQSLPATIAAAGYQAPPPPPKLAPIPAPGATVSARPAETVEIGFAGAATSLGEAARPSLDRVVALYRRNSAKARIRIIGYAGIGGGSLAALKSYRLALARAEAVAAALRRAGIPAKRMRTEAAPAGANSGKGRAEVRIEP